METKYRGNKFIVAFLKRAMIPLGIEVGVNYKLGYFLTVRRNGNLHGSRVPSRHSGLRLASGGGASRPEPLGPVGRRRGSVT